MRFKRRSETFNVWPGYVDILASLLMIITFVIVLLLVIESYLETTIKGIDFEKKELLKTTQSMDEKIKSLELEKNKSLAKNLTLEEKIDILNQKLKQIQIESDQEIEKNKKTLNEKINELLQSKIVLEEEKQTLEEKIKGSMAYYRSEFFSKMKEILKNRDDIVVKGDRFVLKSEIMFEIASSDLSEKGISTLNKFAEIIKEIIPQIPENIDWILRIDGHTDKLPIKTEEFPSNRALSFARAMSVLKHLESKDISSDRLVPAGFGDTKPLLGLEDKLEAPENRRIEIKLDSF